MHTPNTVSVVATTPPETADQEQNPTTPTLPESYQNASLDTLCPDEPFWSLRRILRAIALHIYLIVAVEETPVYVPLLTLIRNYRRPHAAARRGSY